MRFAALVFLAAFPAFAHSPFESSVRAIAHDTSVELVLTVGMDGGKTLLDGAPAEAFQNRAAGQGSMLPSAFAAKIFSTTGDGVALAAGKIVARTDGLEFVIVAEYPRPAGGVFGLDAIYVERLPQTIKSSFVLMNENGNISASRVLKADDHAFEFPLPAIPPGTESVAVAAAPAAVAAEKISPPTPPSPKLSFWDFVKLGIGHILNIGAFDHLLFLTALLLGCRALKPMLLVITGFTLAHSLTLALAALGVVVISSRVVEPLIAASIVFVAMENFRRVEKNWPRYALTCGFGLIHGFGFAGALREAGLGISGAALAVPLLGFNLGVECGQIVVAAVVLPGLFLLRRVKVFERFGTQTISAVVMVVSGWWLLERLFSQ
jgi:hypothetical protein